MREEGQSLAIRPGILSVTGMSGRALHVCGRPQVVPNKARTGERSSPLQRTAERHPVGASCARPQNPT